MEDLLSEEQQLVLLKPRKGAPPPQFELYRLIKLDRPEAVAQLLMDRKVDWAAVLNRTHEETGLSPFHSVVHHMEKATSTRDALVQRVVKNTNHNYYRRTKEGVFSAGKCVNQCGHLADTLCETCPEIYCDVCFCVLHYPNGKAQHVSHPLKPQIDYNAWYRIMKRMVTLGAKVDAPLAEDTRRTPIMLAIASGYTQPIRYLAAQGANLVRTDYGKPLLEYSRIASKFVTQRLPLYPYAEEDKEGKGKVQVETKAEVLEALEHGLNFRVNTILKLLKPYLHLGTRAIIIGYESSALPVLPT